MPQVLSPADLSAEQWSYLLALLKAEAGLGPAPSGTSPGTRLSGITYIGKAYSLWTGEIPGSPRLPAMGVQLKSFKEGDSMTMRSSTTRHAVQTTFDIIMGVQSTDATAAANMGANTPANVEDAMGMLMPLVNDGNGNGISNVLRDPQYRTLGGNALRSQITDITLEWEAGPGESPQIFAYALVTFIAEDRVAIT